MPTSLREHVTLAEVRLPIIARALDRGYMKDLEHQISQIRPHLLAIGTTGPAPAKTNYQRLATKLTNAKYHEELELDIQGDILTINGSFVIPVLGKAILW